jgi:hypothetical protein
MHTTSAQRIEHFTVDYFQAEYVSITGTDGMKTLTCPNVVADSHFYCGAMAIFRPTADA